MPTPSDDTQSLSSVPTDSHTQRSTHTTCPPDSERVAAWRTSPEEGISNDAVSDNTAGAMALAQEHSMYGTDQETVVANENDKITPVATKTIVPQEDDTATESMSPESMMTDVKDSEQAMSPRPVSPGPATTPTSSMNYEFSNIRLLPNHTSSFLRAGSKFTGTQQSDRQVYNVDVEIKHVDMNESYLCGYLRIQGLTEDHPTLTTFFEGEIIGTKHTFQTRHESWGATDKTDMQHWARFPAWRPLAKQAKKPDFTYKNFAQRENIFMRWKEYFLVPDHRVRTISGASFEGFYYICFNQAEGKVSGIYFHAKSEKYQQLELKHVDDKGCFGAMEFR